MTDDEIRRRTRKLLFANITEGHNIEVNKHFAYISPSPERYPYQWFWDTCFHVIILCALGEYEFAKRNMESLFAMQEENGFVGHMLFWESKLVNDVLTFVQAKPNPKIYIPHMSSIIQPPLAAQAVLRIYEDTLDKDFLSFMIPKLKSYHKWLRENRDFEGDGLLSIISPFESGMDWKPTFDAVLDFKHGIANELLYEKVLWVETRNFLKMYDLESIYRDNYFIVKEAGFNTFYSLDILAMSKLCKASHDNETAFYERHAKKVKNSIFDVMYDEEGSAFFDVYGRDNIKIKILTPTIFFPIVIPDMPPDIAKQIFERHLFNEKEFTAPYPIPSVAKNDISFQPNEAFYLWRGPTWIIYNWMLYRCLMTKGFEKNGEQIYRTVKNLIEKSGFREYYNPYTGEGYGALDFTWSGLIVDMMRMEKELKGDNVPNLANR